MSFKDSIRDSTFALTIVSELLFFNDVNDFPHEVTRDMPHTIHLPHVFGPQGQRPRAHTGPRSQEKSKPGPKKNTHTAQTVFFKEEYERLKYQGGVDSANLYSDPQIKQEVSSKWQQVKNCWHDHLGYKIKAKAANDEEAANAAMRRANSESVAAPRENATIDMLVGDESSILTEQEYTEIRKDGPWKKHEDEWVAAFQKCRKKAAAKTNASKKALLQRLLLLLFQIPLFLFLLLFLLRLPILLQLLLSH